MFLAVHKFSCFSKRLKCPVIVYTISEVIKDARRGLIYINIVTTIKYKFITDM